MILLNESSEFLSRSFNEEMGRNEIESERIWN